MVALKEARKAIEGYEMEESKRAHAYLGQGGVGIGMALNGAACTVDLERVPYHFIPPFGHWPSLETIAREESKYRNEHLSISCLEQLLLSIISCNVSRVTYRVGCLVSMKSDGKCSLRYLYAVLINRVSFYQLCRIELKVRDENTFNAHPHLKCCELIRFNYSSGFH